MNMTYSHQSFWVRVKNNPEFIFLRYLMVGLTNTTVCFTTMSIFAYFNFHYLEYTAAGYIVAILYSFFMNLHFTFRVEGKILKRLTLFFCVNLSNLAIVELIEYVLIDKLNWNHLFSILLAMGWYVVSGFLINRYLVYRQKEE